MDNLRTVAKTIAVGVPILFGIVGLATSMQLFVEESFIQAYTILPALLLYSGICLAGAYVFGKMVLDIRSF